MDNFRSKHFSLRHMLVAAVSQRIFGNYTYTVRHGLAAGLRRKGGLGFVPFGPAETEETRFLRRWPVEGKVVYDIGAFEGVLTLFFARKAAQVIAYEPNPRNFQRCMENVKLNGFRNVRVMNRGVGEQPGAIELTYDPLMPGAGSADAATTAQIASSVRSAKTVRIEVVPLDEDIRRHGLPAPDFIKMDIEGMERFALPGMKETLAKYRPELFIEMHGATVEEKVEIAHSVVGFLESAGYGVHDIESGRDLRVATMGEMRPGHIHCRPRP